MIEKEISFNIELKEFKNKADSLSKKIKEVEDDLNNEIDIKTKKLEYLKEQDKVLITLRNKLTLQSSHQKNLL